MQVNFHIPDFINHFFLNTIIIDTIKNNPEYFYDGIQIASVFGNFGGIVWNGGRYIGGTTDMGTVNAVIKILNAKNVPLRFTMTNPLIKREHLGDNFCNRVLRAANNGMNEVIVMSPVLEEYIRENYPDYKITSSTCKQIEDIDAVKEELGKDYKYVVLDYNFNNKFDLLEQIPQEDRGKCEILVNACCQPHCPRRGEHYRQIGQEQINEWEYKKDLLHKNPYQTNVFSCDHASRNIYEITELPTHVSPEDIFEKYVPMGFVNFKIEGRTAPDVQLLETYIYYMVRPEYKDIVRLKILSILSKDTPFFSSISPRRG